MLYKHMLVVCVGVQKAATTTLYELMRKHPEVCVTLKKESGFFYRDDLYSKGYDWFLTNFFPVENKAVVRFEADPNYLYFGQCIDRIYSCDPSSKIIVMLRNPIDRAYSHYLMMKKWGMETYSFEDACKIEPLRISKGECEREDFGYLARSKYASQVKHVLRIFPRDQVRFIVFENFIRNQKLEFEKIQDWLGLSPYDIGIMEENVASSHRSKVLASLMHNHRYRPLRKIIGKLIRERKIRQKIRETIISFNHVKLAARDKPEMNAEFRKMISEQFVNDINETEIITDLDLSIWHV